MVSEAQKKKNMESILAKASKLIKAKKDDAVASGDIDRSFQIANNEASLQNHLKRNGIDYAPSE